MTFLVDLDGTLLNSNGELEKEDIERLIKIQEVGNTIIICTGRTEKEAKTIIHNLEIEKNKGIVILADGQYIIDYMTGERYQQNFLCDKDILDIYKRCPEYKRKNIQVFCSDKSYRIIPNILSILYIKTKIKSLLRNKKEDSYILTRHMLGKTQIQDAEKMTISSDNDLFANNAIFNKYEICYVHDKKRFEIKYRNVNKASAVICAIKNRNMPLNNIQAFGNDDNDICLFKIANVSYAVANATVNVKKEATFILEPVQCAVSRKMIEISMKER